MYRVSAHLFRFLYSVRSAPFSGYYRLHGNYYMTLSTEYPNYFLARARSRHAKSVHHFWRAIRCHTGDTAPLGASPQARNDTVACQFGVDRYSCSCHAVASASHFSPLFPPPLRSDVRARSQNPSPTYNLTIFIIRPRSYHDQVFTYPRHAGPELHSGRTEYSQHGYSANHLRVLIDFRVTMAIICCDLSVSHGIWMGEITYYCVLLHRFVNIPYEKFQYFVYYTIQITVIDTTSIVSSRQIGTYLGTYEMRGARDSMQNVMLYYEKT